MMMMTTISVHSMDVLLVILYSNDDNNNDNDYDYDYDDDGV